MNLTVFLTCFLLYNATVKQPIASGMESRVSITVKADGQPIDQKTGLSIHSKKLQFKGVVQIIDSQRQKNIEEDLLIQEVKLTLSRNGRVLAYLQWDSVSQIENFSTNAQPGDFLILQFKVAVKNKESKIITLSTQPIYKFPFY